MTGERTVSSAYFGSGKAVPCPSKTSPLPPGRRFPAPGHLNTPGDDRSQAALQDRPATVCGWLLQGVARFRPEKCLLASVSSGESRHRCAGPEGQFGNDNCVVRPIRAASTGLDRPTAETMPAALVPEGQAASHHLNRCEP